jgi:CheY-like chemotaxis protein
MEDLKGRFSGMKVLVIEESFACYLLVKEYLRVIGIKCTQAVSYEELEKALEKGDINMVILNGSLPFNNQTLELTKKIKTQRPYLPVIVQNTFLSPEIIEQYFAAGCDATLTKPYKKEDIAEVIENICFASCC